MRPNAVPHRILLVDDEAPLLALLKRHIERSGFVVVACLSAEQATAAVESTDWEPDILVADETLPGMSGTELAGLLLERFPRLLILLCSGYPMSIEVLPQTLRARAAILQKPFLPTMLERAIAELLER